MILYWAAACLDTDENRPRSFTCAKFLPSASILKVFDVNLSEFSHISQKKLRELGRSALPDPIQLRGILSHL